MTPNQVTLARVAAAFAAVALFTFGADALAADFAAVLLTVAAIALDGVDGYLARSWIFSAIASLKISSSRSSPSAA
ncbi:MAG: CDP-alcohol phosphatidyltransferase family protein [Acidobacteriia bacterium]|nr:CDP-alcohol phosphatidyltransferase family protein [Terriglobia bacterium]